MANEDTSRAFTQPVDIARARKAHQRLVDVAFRNRDKETGELIQPHFEIPAHPNDDDIIVSRALDELERHRAAAAVERPATTEEIAAAAIIRAEKYQAWHTLAAKIEALMTTPCASAPVLPTSEADEGDRDDEDCARVGEIPTSKLSPGRDASPLGEGPAGLPDVRGSSQCGTCAHGVTLASPCMTCIRYGADDPRGPDHGRTATRKASVAWPPFSASDEEWARFILACPGTEDVRVSTAATIISYLTDPKNPRRVAEAADSVSQEGVKR
jgi:hypothetical protein